MSQRENRSEGKKWDQLDSDWRFQSTDCFSGLEPDNVKAGGDWYSVDPWYPDKP